MKKKPRQRRSLSNVGGRSILEGDGEVAHRLKRCMDVGAGDTLPFTHGFHAYPARMHPEIARRAIELFRPGRIIDPFVGSGTTALEAVRAGLPFIGSDMSRVAIEIAWARTRIWKPDRCRAIEAEGQRIGRQARSVRLEAEPSDGDRADWFSSHTYQEIELLRSSIDALKDPDLRRILRVVLSSLMVRLSRQESDSIAKPDSGFRPWPPGAAYRLFSAKCSELTQNLLLLSSDLYKRKIQASEPDLRCIDSRTLKIDLRDGDLVLTSPPYPGVYDYAHHHRLRYEIFGEKPDFAEQHEIASRRAMKLDPQPAVRYRHELQACLKPLAPAPMILLVGDALRVRTDQVVEAIATQLRLRVRARATQRRFEWTLDRRRIFKNEHLIHLAP